MENATKSGQDEDELGR